MVGDEKYILNNEQANAKKTWRRPDFACMSLRVPIRLTVDGGCFFIDLQCLFFAIAVISACA